MEEVLFASAAQKLARAREHFDDLKGEIERFQQREPYATFSETHPDEPSHQIHKIRMTEPVPTRIGDLVGDSLAGMRNALDHGCNAIARMAGHVNPKYAVFPFGGSEAKMVNSMGRSKDLPKQIQTLLLSFKPYRGGNDLLWALNELNNGDKHAKVVAVGTGVMMEYGRAWAKGVRFSIPREHIWDVTKNEMEIISFRSPGTNYEYDFKFGFFIAFGEVDVIAGKDVLGVLDDLGGEVERILLAIEAEALRIGMTP